ncbi:DUF4843 domain-containing protein [Sphingobacterium alkalisoli]|uniref:DUF4843 domain-containing protein n=1 Tax=Sphingobacterium alkalisoli TaxID=1874115 RepID=A0A4U0GZ31_9SPHI|nr:DUF4843 domain-containing protein [Sphingobacterium alkalisoli]TJY64368.1 DUF4843 domain-containing protein [Sphingobacterium alkalisoli]GGH22171.1 hypothetical protein GCM10011418_28550 [Sphingobacterium alkalisoli]
MKIYRNLILVLVVLMTSCEKSGDLFFDKEQTDINIWLGSSTIPQDSVSFNFSHMLPGRDSLIFHYRLLSYPLDHDVDFELEAIDGDIDLVYFSFGKYTIKAGEYQGRFPIYFDKPEVYNEFKDKAGKLRFRLKAGGAIKTGIKELSTLTVILQNGISKPDQWDVAPLYYGPLWRYFGTYSLTKHSLLIQQSGRTDFRVITMNNAVTQEDTEALSVAEAIAIVDKCKKWLLEYKAQNNGEPYRDENENEVIFP